MNRYIDADLLKQCVQDNITRYFTCGTGGYCLAEDVVEDIDTFPTADVVEVRHGHWYFVEYEYFSCSECGESYYNGCEYTAQAKECLKNGDYYSYCPHCGAKMDGERSEQNEG